MTILPKNMKINIKVKIFSNCNNFFQKEKNKFILSIIKTDFKFIYMIINI